MSLLLEDSAVTRKSREEALAEMPEELRTQAAERLQSPNLLRWIIDGIEKVGVAGERPLALTLWLAGTSRLLEHPLAVIVQGPSASGKSYVIDQIAKLFPAEAVLSATDITPNALYFMPPGELAQRFIVAGERSRRQHDDSAQATKALREIIASGHLEKLITISDGDGPRTELVQQQGPIAYAESTTAPELFEEDANRCLVLQPDERPEQTQRILRASGFRLLGIKEQQGRNELREEFHALQRLLEPLTVVIPFADRLADLFPTEPIEVRRAFGHVTSLIQTSALLHQFQRSRDELGRIVAQPEDYWLARLLLRDVLARSLGQRPADALRRFVERLQDERFSGEYTAQEIAKALVLNERTVREHLNELLKLGRIEQTQAPRGPIPARWMIGAEIGLDDQGDELLPSLVNVCGCDDDALGLPELPEDWLSANLTEVPF